MPGIAGIISPTPKEANIERLQRMLASMHQEPFYSSGAYTNATAGVYVGWNCYKGSFCDCLPIVDQKKHRVLLFYGESFGETQHENQNARALVDLFDEENCETLRLLNGWFHGVLVDLRQNQVSIFSDRYGMQRLYYHQDADSFLFASEAKAILAVKRELRTLDLESVGELLTCDCVLGDRTIFSGVRTFPGGAEWIFRNGQLQNKGYYFKPEEWESQAGLAEEEFVDELQRLFARVVPRYIRSGLPVAVSLTGGLDTRAIMAFVDHRPANLRCYTFGGMYRESYDVKIARKVASSCGQSHQVIPLGSDFLSTFPELAEKTVYISDGCLGACEAYELYFNKLARDIADVRLTGNYGSEILRGIRAFKAAPLSRKLIHSDFWKYVRHAIENFEEISRCQDLTFSAFQQAPWHGYGRVSVEQSQLVLRTPFMDNELVALMYRAPHATRKSSRAEVNLIEQQRPRLMEIPTDRMLHRGVQDLSATYNYLFSRVLFKLDYYCKSGMPQWLEQVHYVLRRLRLEQLVLGRHRLTFFRGWFRNELAEYVKDILLDPLTGSRSHVNRKYLQAIVLRHTKGDRNYTNEIQRLINLELIYRVFIDD